MITKLKYAIGIDLGGTFIKFGLVSSIGELLYEGILPTEADKSSEKVIENITMAIELTLQYASQNKISLIGIGIGTPGIIDKTNRVVVAANNIVGWSNILLANEIEKAFPLPVSINNDANLMGLGEQAFGAAKGYSDVLFLTIGTGIGGAIIINNSLFTGYENRGAELGHIPLIANGVSCLCGGTGCFEAYASTNALIQQFEKRCKDSGENISEEITGKLIIKLYHENNHCAIESLNEHCRFLAQGIAGLVNVFSPQLVVIGGGISEAGAFYVDKIKAEFDKFVIANCALHTEMIAARLGNKAGILGAAQWAFVRVK